MGDLLFLAHRIPYPPDRGDKIRSFHLLDYLSRRKRVHLVTFADTAADLHHDAALARYTASRAILWRAKSRARATLEALVRRQPVSLATFDSAAARQAVATALTRHDIDTIYVFSSQMAQYLPAQPRQSVIMDFVDMDSAKFATYAHEARGPLAWLLAREARLLQGWEEAVAARVDASLFVTEAEAELFRQRTGASRIGVAGNGIDADFYDPATACEQGDADRPLLVFTGQMDYRPNIDAVTWFAEAILPHVRQVHPQARFAIVGRKPAAAVQALTRHPGVIVTGEVADVRGWLARAAVAVAPLRLARGVQNKVLEAMAMARPVVASTPAAEGIDHGGAIMVGDDATGIAAAVTRLLDDPHQAQQLGQAARQQVKARYNWNVQLAPLDPLLELAS